MDARRRTLLIGAGAAFSLVAALAVADPATSAPTMPAWPEESASHGAALATTVPDRPDALAAARTARVERQGAWLRESLPAGDVDVFRFQLKKAAPVQVTLGALPADYDLAVYTSSGHKLGASARKGVTFDEVWLRLPAGDVFAVVRRKRGAKAGTYSLRLRSFSPGVHTLSTRRSAVPGEVVGEFYNATPQWHTVSELDVEWLDKKGRVAHTDVEPMDPAQWIRPWSRVPFLVRGGLTLAQDQSYRAVRITPRLVTDTPTLPALSARITRTRTYGPDPSGTAVREYWGTVSTTSRTKVRDVRVYVCEYDASGTLQNLTKADPIQTLPAHGSRPWHGDNSYGSYRKPQLVIARAYVWAW